MSLEERVSRLEERVAELLIAQAAFNDKYDKLVNRIVGLENSNESLRLKLTYILSFLDMNLDDLSAEGQLNLTSWLQQAIKRRIN